MSTIKADLLQNRLGTNPPAVTKADFVKSYGRANQVPATPVLEQSLNVSSMTDDGVGLTRFYFTAGFLTGAPVGACTGAPMAGYNSTFTDASGISASSIQLIHVEAAVAKDTAVMCAVIMGVLA